MDGLRREGRRAHHNNMFSSSKPRRTAPNPVPRPGDGRLTGRGRSQALVGFHGECAPEDSHVVLELRRVARLDPSTRTLHIRNTHRRRVQIHPTGKFLNYPRLIANDSISVGCAMSMTTDFRWLPFLTINSSRTYGTRQTGYCSTMVVSTQAEWHVHHTDLSK
jgi:hypothetical protein